MASQTSDQTATGTDRVSFELERLAFDDHRRLVVTGRWFGVRGRRFVRPTLTLTMRADGTEQRALADLEHKPWAADEGEPWLASFALDVELKDAEQIELSVAPDIAVDLPQSRGAARKRPVAQPANDARAPRVRTDRVQARPSTADQAYELDRLRSRLAAAERAIESERTKRTEADRALEDERSEARRLRSQLGQLRSELDIAQATGGELAAASSELDRVRTQGRESDRQLQATIRSLDQQRAESERLRMRLTAAEATVARLTRAHETSERAERERAERSAGSGSSGVQSRVFDSIGSAVPITPPPAPAPAVDEVLYPGESRPRARADGRGSQHRTPPRTDQHLIRPINPALRSRPNWVLRGLTLIVLIGVIVAIILVIHSTIA